MTPTTRDIDLANTVILEVGEAIRAFFRAEKREKLTSVMFDVPRRSMLGWNCIYDHGPAIFRELGQHATPEQIGRRMRRAGTRPYQLQMALLFLAYLGARQQRILDLGLSDGDAFPAEDVENTVEFIDFIERIQRSYRGDGSRLATGARPIARVLDPDAVDEVRALLQPARAEEFRPMQRTLGILEMYAFLLHGEQRDGVFGHGPYELTGGSRLFVREINDLQNDYLPWAETEAQNPYPNVIFAYEAPGVELTCDLFGTLVVDSPDLQERLRASAVMTRAEGGLRRLGHSELKAVEAAAAAATRELYKAIAGWSDRYRLDYGAPLFANHVLPFFTLQGGAGDIGPRLMDMFERTARETGAELLAADVPSVWQHMVWGEGRCFFPIVS